MRMTVECGISQQDAESVAGWTNERGPEFLCQWAGPVWGFPLSVEQMMSSRPFSIFVDGKFIGTISEIGREGHNVHIGRFLIDPELTGRGIGGEALKQFCVLLFDDAEIETVSLKVYDYNKSALSCYIRCGFAVTGAIDGSGGPSSVRMVLRREDLAR